MINIKAKGLNAIRGKLGRVKGALELTKVNKAASIFLDRWVQQNFKGEGSNVGGWENFLYGGRITPKKKGGVLGKDGRYVKPSAKLLQDSGNLRKSFHPFYDSKSAGIGSKLPYAKAHDQGEGHMIQRRILPEDSDVQAGLKNIYGKHVRTALNA